MRAVTGPLDNRLVRQMVPSPGKRKQGSRGPRRKGAKVCPKLTAPGNVTVREYVTASLPPAPPRSDARNGPVN
ncbi:hypothetical protein MKUB_02510 [Mycobacterium kubicae]|uniref:Transposase n=1 Tax=Mycobacterium kubicae TaxID=120959 RepID=A0ABQ1BGC7_9MYCO|nr:hypothetical protein MKUB_02510 [Mycobacterium kubicae]